MPAAARGPEPPIAVIRFETDPGAPITISFVGAPVEVMIVAKDSVPLAVNKIAPGWAQAGVYVLLGPTTNNSVTVRARPGSGADVLKRLRQHPGENPWFTRAVVVRDIRQGWNTAEAGYVEGRLHDLCRDSPAVQHDYRRDHDDTLQEHEERAIELHYLPGIIAALRLAGVEINPTWTPPSTS